MTDIDTTVEQAGGVAEPQPSRGLVIRHVLERQLGAGQSLGAQLIGASTDVSVALAQAPAAVVDEIRGGATLPAALAHTRTEVRDAIVGTGTRVRGAVGEWVGAQATLPNALVVGAADVAEAVLRAQGTVAATAVDSAFTVATTAARGGDVADVVRRSRRSVVARTEAARAEIAESWERAAEEVRGAVTDDEEYLEDAPDEN